MSFSKHCAPAKLTDLRFADPLVSTQIHNFVNNNVADSLLLYGPPGSGKSQIGKVILQERICKNFGVGPSFFTIQGSSFPPISDMQGMLDLQLTNVSFGLIVIDEYDQISLQNQQKIRAFLDKTSVCGLILTTNHFANIEAPMRSRMRCMEIQCPPPAVFLDQADNYLKSQSVNIDRDDILNVLTNAGSDLRSINRAIEDLKSASLKSASSKSASVIKPTVKIQP